MEDVTNFVRLSVLLLDFGRDVLIEIFRKKVPFGDFLDEVLRNKKILKKRLNYPQRKLIFRSKGKMFIGSYEEMDFTLLCLLSKYLLHKHFEYDSEISAIKSLLDLKGLIFCNYSGTFIDSEMFDNYWSKSKQALVHLGSEIYTETEMETKINELYKLGIELEEFGQHEKSFGLCYNKEMKCNAIEKQYKFTKCTSRFVQVSKGLFDLSKDILLKLLFKRLPPKDFTKTMQLRWYMNQILEHARNNSLVKKEWRTRLMDVDKECQVYADFDFKLTYLLLRHFGNIPHHSTGWGKPPMETDVSLSAQLDRLNAMRYKLSNYQYGTEIVQSDFEEYKRNLVLCLQETQKCVGADENLEKQLNLIFEDEKISRTQIKKEKDPSAQSGNLVRSLSTVTNTSSMSGLSEDDASLSYTPSTEKTAVFENLYTMDGENETEMYTTSTSNCAKRVRMDTTCASVKKENINDSSDTSDKEIEEGAEAPRDTVRELRSAMERLKTHHGKNLFKAFLGYFDTKPETIFIVAYLKQTVTKCKYWELFERFQVLYIDFLFVGPEGAEVMHSRKSLNNRIPYKDMTCIHDLITAQSDHLMKKHSNLEMISACSVKSQWTERKTFVKTCIVLYCRTKGLIPLGEENFPKEIGGYPTDVREGLFQWAPGDSVYQSPGEFHESLKMGCNIGLKGKEKRGSLGGFVDTDTGIGFLTCAHVLYDKETLEKHDSPSDSDYVVQPADGEILQDDNRERVCGKVLNYVFYPSGPVGVDAALVSIDNRRPIEGMFTGLSKRALASAGFDPEGTLRYNSGTIRRLSEDDMDRRVIKSGAMTGLTRGVFNFDGACVKVYDTELYLDPSVPDTYSMRGQIEILGVGGNVFAQSGDSGSFVLLVEQDKSLTCIGMVEGWTTHYSTIVTPIIDILDKLELDTTQLHAFLPPPEMEVDP